MAYGGDCLIIRNSFFGYGAYRLRDLEALLTGMGAD
jgi:hypothetical protein